SGRGAAAAISVGCGLGSCSASEMTAVARAPAIITTANQVSTRDHFTQLHLRVSVLRKTASIASINPPATITTMVATAITGYGCVAAKILASIADPAASSRISSATSLKRYWLLISASPSSGAAALAGCGAGAGAAGGGSTICWRILTHRDS